MLCTCKHTWIPKRLVPPMLRTGLPSPTTAPGRRTKGGGGTTTTRAHALAVLRCASSSCCSFLSLLRALAFLLAACCRREWRSAVQQRASATQLCKYSPSWISTLPRLLVAPGFALRIAPSHTSLRGANNWAMSRRNTAPNSFASCWVMLSNQIIVDLRCTTRREQYASRTLRFNWVYRATSWDTASVWWLPTLLRKVIPPSTLSITFIHPSTHGRYWSCKHRHDSSHHYAQRDVRTR